jgi:tetratricopeptide (TPR) repeat protein/predicted regulator of Ras-like GTPase activity (Roadblock/LC7/MglB family)
MLKQEQRTTLERKIDRFAEILKEKPDDGLTVLALAEASFRRGLKLEALTAYQIVTKAKPVPEAHLAVAEIYSQQNMTTEAYGELRQLFHLEPNNVEARLLAHQLEEQTPAPDDISAILNRPADDEAFAESRLRLQIQRAIHNRELQERTRNVTLEPGVVIHEYYVEEAKKKLIEVNEQLRKLEELKLFNATLSIIPQPELISAQEEAAVEPVPEPETLTITDVPLTIQDSQEIEEVAPALEVDPSSQTSEPPGVVQMPSQELLPAEVPEEASSETSVPALDAGEMPYEIGLDAVGTPDAVPGNETITGSDDSEIQVAAEIEAVALEVEASEPVEVLETAEVSEPADVSPAAEGHPAEESHPAVEVSPVEVSPTVEVPPPVEVAVAPEAFEAADSTADEPSGVPVEVSIPEVPDVEETSLDLEIATASEAYQLAPELPEPVVDAPEIEAGVNELEQAPDFGVVELDVAPVALEPDLPDPDDILEIASPAEAVSGQESFQPPSIGELSSVSIEPDLPPEIPAVEPVAPISSAPSEEVAEPMEAVAIKEFDSEVSVSEAPSIEIDLSIGASPVQPELPDEAVISPPGLSEPPSIQLEDLPSPSIQLPATHGIQVELDPVSIEPIEPLEIQPAELTTMSTVPHPLEVTDPVEDLPPTPEPPLPHVDPAALAAERQVFYESKAEELGKLTAALARTRGVTSIFLVARDGTTIDSVVKDEITEQRVGELVRESFDFLLAYAKSPAYWVLECTGGIFVMQTLDADHVLIAIGQAGANFGALRYTMDKTKTKFGAIFQDVPR